MPTVAGGTPPILLLGAMKYYHAFANGLSTLGIAVAVVVLIGMTGLILAEVVLRSVFASSTHAADELVGYGVGALSFLALGHSLEKRSLIRMNLLISRFDSRGIPRRGVEVVCVLLGIMSCSIAFYFFARNVVRNYERGYVSETMAQIPLWIPESFVAIGLGIFVLQLVSYLIRVVENKVDLNSSRAAELGGD